jgi:hypothetical protein
MCWFGKKKKPESWNSDLCEDDVRYLTGDKLAYMVEESRLYLQSINENTGRMVGKAAILLGFITAGIGYIITKFISNYYCYIEHYWQAIFWIGWLIILLYDFFTLIRYQLPSLDYPVGTPPENLLLKEYIKFDYERIIVPQLELYQRRIDNNEKRSLQMAKNIKVCFALAVIYPIVIAIGYLFFILVKLLSFWFITFCIANHTHLFYVCF